MALNLSFAGRSYPPTSPYEVGREKIREFARAIGDSNPVYSDPEAAKAFGHPDVIAPPTFPIVITMSAADQAIKDPALGLDFARSIHRTQRFVYSRPIRPGDQLSIVITVDIVKSLADHDIVSYRGEVRDSSGEHVVTVYTSLTSRAADAEETA